MTTSSFPSGSQRFPHLHDFHGAQNIQGISPETPPKRQRQGCLGSQCFFLMFLTTTTATQREIQVETRPQQHAAMQSGGACWQVFGSSCQEFWNGLVSSWKWPVNLVFKVPWFSIHAHVSIWNKTVMCRNSPTWNVLVDSTPWNMDQSLTLHFIHVFQSIWTYFLQHK